VDFKAVGAGILKISKHERAKRKKERRDRQKANTKMIWGRLRDVKEGDRIVEDERG
jgi:hypothetical protein